MGKKRADSTVIERDEMTLMGRIRIGMATKGITTSSQLAERLKMRRQTVHKWTTGEVKKIEPENLFKLAAVLDLNPIWLANREGAPQPQRTVSLDDQRVLDLYNALPESVRKSWLQSGDALLSATAPPSTSRPFKTESRQ